jgi:diguanylate cyclase (GGDEF)-like protein/PAS domain S-box-containing protein
MVLDVASFSADRPEFRRLFQNLVLPLEPGDSPAGLTGAAIAFQEIRVVGPADSRGSVCSGDDPKFNALPPFISFPVSSSVFIPELSRNREEPYGVLILDSMEPGSFNDEKKQIVLQIVRALGLSLDRLDERRRILDLLEKSSQEKGSLLVQNYLSRILLEIGRMLRDSTKEKASAIFQEALNHLVGSLDLPVVWLGEVRPGESAVRVIALAGPGKEHFEGVSISIDSDLPEGRGLSGESVVLGGPREAQDISRDPRFGPWRDRFMAGGLESGLVDSARTKEGNILILALYRKRSGKFSPDIVSLISGLVRDLAAFLDRCQVEVRKDQLFFYQAAVREIQTGLLSAESPGEMFDLLVRTIVERTSLIGAYVLVPERTTEWFLVQSAAGKSTEIERAARALRLSIDPHRPVFGESLPGMAFRTRKPQGPVKPEHFSSDRALKETHPAIRLIQSAMAWPILIPKQTDPYAVFVVWSPDEKHFTPELEGLLSELSAALSLGIERLERESEVQRLSLVAQKATDSILLTDLHGKILWVNRSFEEKFGFTLAEVTGQPLIDLRTGPDSDSRKFEILRSHVKTGRSFDEIMLYYTRGGTPCWVRVNATLLRQPDGIPTGYIIVESDVTALKDSEERARITSIFYRALSETLQTLWTFSQPLQDVLTSLLAHLKTILEADIFYLGCLPSGKTKVETLAYLGPPEWLQGLSLSSDPDRPDGQGPAGMVLRTGHPTVHLAKDPTFPAPMRERDRRFGIAGSLSASSLRENGDRILLEAHFSKEDLLNADSGDLFGRMTMEIASFLDRKGRQARNEKIEHYRTARQLISKQLLSAESEEEIFGILARTIVEETGALAVDWLSPEGDRLKRRALEGPLAHVIRSLPSDLSQAVPESGPVPAPVRAWNRREPVLVKTPAKDPTMLDVYRTPPFEAVALVSTFPIPGRKAEDSPIGVVTLFTDNPDTFDDTLLTGLVQDILESASLGVERLLLLQKMRDLSTLDPLTKVLNRRGLDLALAPFLANVSRGGGEGVLGILDLDDFKPVNDEFGHAAGDELLVQIARRLSGTLREGDLVARLGGDEFVVVMQWPTSSPDEEAEFLSVIMGRIQEVLSVPYRLQQAGGKEIEIGCSMGVTLFPRDESEPDGLLRHADEALYLIKGQKKTRRHWWRLWTGAATFEMPFKDPLAEAKSLLFSEIYGTEARELIGKVSELLEEGVTDFSEIFYETLARDRRISSILTRLSPDEFHRLKESQTTHLKMLLGADLEEGEHRRSARRLGRIHAMVGLSPADMVEAMRIYLSTLQETIRKLAIPLGERTRLLSLVTHRSGVELSEQIAGMSDLDTERQTRIVALTNSLIHVRSWPDFVRLVLTSLVQEEGIIGSVLFRPSDEGAFVAEFSAGRCPLLSRFLSGDDPPLPGGEGGGQIGALHSEIGEFLREMWRNEAALSVPGIYSESRLPRSRMKLLEEGIRSLAIFPLKDPDDHLFGALLIVSSHPGYFETPSMATFENALQSLFRQGRHRFDGISPARLHSSGLPHQSLRALLAEKRILLEYQPVVDFSDRSSRKVEALARIVSSEGRLIVPADFIGAFGRSELADLFRQGLASSLEQIRTWENQGVVLDLALNIPPVVLFEPHLLQWVDQALGEVGVPPSRLHLELLESQEIRDTARQQRTVEEIVARGIHLDMDDLGAGYSSLLRLRTMPFSTVKIDQGLVRGYSENPEQLISLVGSLVKLIQGLGHSAVIEGLENPDLIEVARILGADGGQGYALSRPLPAEKVPGWIEQYSLPPRREDPVSSLGRLARDWMERQYGSGKLLRDY